MTQPLSDDGILCDRPTSVKMEKRIPHRNQQSDPDPAMPHRGSPGTGFDPAHPALVRAGRAAFGDGFRLRSVARTASTQDAVRAAARAGAAPGTCWVAAEQSSGRGRQGRAWEAPAGTALLTSVLLRPAGPLGWVPLAAGLAVIDALRSCARVEARLKWPNDVLAEGGRKLAGLLAEVEPRAPRRSAPAVVLGIGLNLGVEHFPAGIAGASLHRLTDPLPPPLPEEVLAALLTALTPRLAQVGAGQAGLDRLRADWKASATGLGATVRAVTPGGELHGVATGLDADGALLITDPAGTVHRLVAGDVHTVS